MNNDTRLVSPRARFYLVTGITMFVFVLMLYVLAFERDSVLTYLQSYPLPIFAVATFSAILSGWVQARAQMSNTGIFLKSLGKGLIIFGAGAMFFLKLPESVVVLCFVLGLILSVLGTMQFRAARRRLEAANRVADQSQPPI